MKNFLSFIMNEDDCIAVNEPKFLLKLLVLIWAVHQLRKTAGDDEHHVSTSVIMKNQGKKREYQRLHEHDHAEARSRLTPPFPDSMARSGHSLTKIDHLQTAPKMTPSSKYLLRRMVKAMTGTRKIVARAATAGQSYPPTLMIVGTKGGLVSALPEVSE